jgi:hypothetical protein
LRRVRRSMVDTGEQIRVDGLEIQCKLNVV